MSITPAKNPVMSAAGNSLGKFGRDPPDALSAAAARKAQNPAPLARFRSWRVRRTDHEALGLREYAEKRRILRFESGRNRQSVAARLELRAQVILPPVIGAKRRANDRSFAPIARSARISGQGPHEGSEEENAPNDRRDRIAGQAQDRHSAKAPMQQRRAGPQRDAPEAQFHARLLQRWPDQIVISDGGAARRCENIAISRDSRLDATLQRAKIIAREAESSGSPPAHSTSAAIANPFEATISCEPTASPGNLNSSPVARMPTFGRRATGSSAWFIAAASAIDAGPSLSPARNKTSPAVKSRPAQRMCCPAATPCVGSIDPRFDPRVFLDEHCVRPFGDRRAGEDPYGLARANAPTITMACSAFANLLQPRRQAGGSDARTA